jgi:hypothetical protein
MNFKSTALLFGLLLGMLWLFGLMLTSRKGTREEDLVFPSMHDSRDLTIDQVEVVRKEKGKLKDKFEFTREKDNWRMKEPPLAYSIRAEGFKVDQLVRQIKEARRDEEADVSSDFAAYDLVDPPITVTLQGHFDEGKDKEKKKTTKTWTFFVGKETAAYAYVKSSDRNQVLAVRRSALDSVFFKGPGVFRPKSFLEVNENTARYVGLKGEGADVELRRNDDATWRFLKPNYGLADFEGKAAEKPSPFQPKPKQEQKTEGGVKGLLSAIGFIRVASDADFVPLSDTALSKFGLEKGKENIRIQVGTEGEKKDEDKDKKKENLVKETLYIGIKVKDKDQYYARMANDPGIAKVDGKLLEPILTVLKSEGRNLRSRDIVPFDTKTVDAIDIKKGKSLAELLKFRNAKPWKIYLGYDKHKADDKTMEAFIDALHGKGEIKEFFDEPEAEAKKKDAERGLDQPQAEVLLYKDALEKEEAKDESTKSKKDKKSKDKKGKDQTKDKDKKKDEEPKLKKDAKPAVTLTFGKTEKEIVFVKRVTQDGTVSRFAAPKSIIEKILPPEGVLAFFDTALPSFELGNVTQFEVDKDGDKTVVQRGHGEQLGKFLLKDKKDYAGRNFADTAQSFTILQDMGRLHARKWVQKIGAKDDLKPFGLEKPGLTVTVWVEQDKTLPKPLASAVGLFGAPVPAQGLLALTSLQAWKENPKEWETYVYKFGKEFKDKDTPVSYALSNKNDYLFQVPVGTVKLVKDADLRDRSWLTQFQPLLDAGFVGSGA